MSAHPTLPGELLTDGFLGDSDASWRVVESDPAYDSAYLSVRVDTIAAPDGSEHPRVVVSPHGAVGVAALDDDGNLLLVEQYRHPVGRRLLELPAGTLDVEGESGLDAARRELAEEADVVAGTWEPLLRPYASPGYSSEAWEVFVARDLSPTDEADRFEREAEEADMRQLWVPFADALAAVLDGRIADSMTVAGILALHARGLA